MKQYVVLLFFIMFTMIACNKNKVNYPETRKVDTVDNYFGTQVADPYRWLEDDNSDETKAWVKAENEVTEGYLSRIPYREKIRQRLTEIYNYPRYSSPFRAGDYYFFYKNDGLQNQSVIYIQKGLDGTPEVFIDPNQLSADGTVRVNLVGISRDDKYITYSRSEAGSDWQELRVMEIATRKEVADRIQWVKFSGSAWDGSGFYYSGYDKPVEGEELTAANKFQKIFYHKLGDPQAQDKLIYEDKEHPLRYKSADITEDGKFLILTVSEGTQGNELYYKELASKSSGFMPLVTGFEHNSGVIDNTGDKFLVITDTDAPKYKVILMDPKKPAKDNWQTVIPEQNEVLSSASTAGGALFCTYLKDAATRVIQYDYAGAKVREIEMPALGTAGGFSGKKVDGIVFYTFTSFTFPPTIYKYEIASGKSEVFRKSEVKFNPEDYEIKQVFVTSKDSTQVPVFLVYKKGMELNGKNPTLLYAYGGFNISMQPGFNPTNLVLLENGGIYAMACLRGGGEYGEDWHKAGMLGKKQNVFDDFIAAAEYLVKEKYTSSRRLAIAGGSNGGLLVGAVMTQRPELFKVAFPAVGVMDMLRFHKFTVGWGWVVEYGSSDNEKDFKYLYAYSPLHNIRPAKYPATMVTTADHDDRVVPAHSFKFAATLQEMNKGSNPELIRIETRSGHGASSTTKVIEELTDRWSFMFYNMSVTPRY